MESLGYLMWQAALDIRRAIENDAHFLIVSCGGEVCSKCERPLWQHVENLAVRLCPTDGLPYWRMVWAILRAEGHGEETIREVVREITSG